MSLAIQSDNISHLWRLKFIGILDVCENYTSKELENETSN